MRAGAWLAIGAAIMSLVGGTMAGSIVGKRSGLSPVASLGSGLSVVD